MSMYKYVIKRILLAFVTLFIILSLTFILVKLLPFQKPVGTNEQMFSYYADQVADGYVMDVRSPSSRYGELLWSYRDASNRNHYYYQVPVMQQYGAWLRNIFTAWDWGTSVKIQPNVQAMVIIGERLPTSISINIISVIISVPLGIAFGIWAALKKNKPTDHIISTVVMILIAVPSFVLITFLLYIFATTLHWLPTQWPSPSADLGTRVAGYVLPVVCLSFGSICGYTRFVRAELCEVMSSEYLLLARTKGLTKRQAILRHALRNAMVPIVPSILAEFISILGGSMILENIYGIPGIGNLFVTALNSPDYNVLFVDMAVFTSIGLLAGIFLDLSYGFIDPRIRMGAKK